MHTFLIFQGGTGGLIQLLPILLIILVFYFLIIRPQQRRQRQLQETVANLKIGDRIVTNGGVASTARDAHMRDYRVLVLGDGCAASTPAAHDTALADLRTIGDLTTCEAFADRLAT